jgi:ATP-dependent RNA helicase RhlE
MLNLGFRTQLTAILAMMPKTSKHLFSATMTDEVDAILNDYFDYRKRLRFQPLGPLENIKQIAYMQLISILK